MKRLVLLVAALLLVTACSVRTLGAPTGHTTLYATFDDAQNLVAGHSVQLADVKVGSVTGVRLVSGYRARVAMSIKDGVRIPQGTSAEVSVTSLLGENYVKLTLPPGGSLDHGPFMASGAAFEKTSVQPEFEQVVGQAGTLIQAVSGNDVGTIVDAGAQALGGNGQNLHTILAKSSTLVQLVADQKSRLADTVDQFATLSKSLADGRDALDQAPGRLERTTQLLNDNKAKILDTITKLTAVARQINDRVLAGRVEELRTLLTQLEPVLAQLGDNRQKLTDLVNGLVVFTHKLPLATYDGQLLLYPILSFILPGQKTTKPAAPKTSVSPPAAPAAPAAPKFQLPDFLKNLFPNLGGSQ